MNSAKRCERHGKKDASKRNHFRRRKGEKKASELPRKEVTMALACKRGGSPIGGKRGKDMTALRRKKRKGNCLGKEKYF